MSKSHCQQPSAVGSDWNTVWSNIKKGMTKKQRAECKAYHLCSELAVARTKLGLTQQQLAAMSGLRLSKIKKIEALWLIPTLDELCLLARCLNQKIVIQDVETQKKVTHDL